MQCSERNNSMVVDTEKILISAYHKYRTSSVQINTTQKCMERCQKISRNCSAVIYKKNQHLCEWYQETLTNDYSMVNVDGTTDDALMRVCLTGMSFQLLTLN